LSEVNQYKFWSEACTWYGHYRTKQRRARTRFLGFVVEDNNEEKGNKLFHWLKFVFSQAKLTYAKCFSLL